MSLRDENIDHCEACGCAMDVTVMQPFTNVECPQCKTHNRVKVDIGSYILKQRQGVGGMSLVFAAVDKTLGREVAIKILNENYSMDAKRTEQFEQEAKITAAISHPHVVRVYTVGKAFQRFFIAMELVPGDSLEQKMHAEGALPESDVLKWGEEVCEGLNAANEAGLIHRDIKPGNILFDSEGHVKIVDFGLALVTQGGKAQADEIWATPYYVSPETLDVLEEDFRSDIYALGASLFHALSGNPPFTTESRSTSDLKKIKMKLPTLKKSAPWLNDETCAVIDKAMSFSADDRYSSYKEFIDALRRAQMSLQNGGVMPVMGDAESSQDNISSDKKKRYGIAAVCALTIGGGVLAWSLNKGDKVEVSDARQDTKMKGIEGSDDGGAAGKRLASSIREGRKALQSKKYYKAAGVYSSIARDNRFDINSVMWGGLQAAMINWINGSPSVARENLKFIHKDYLDLQDKKEVINPADIVTGLLKDIPLLLDIKRIDPAGVESIKSESGAMLLFASALKNWENGYFSDAVQMFDSVAAYASEKGGDVSEEFRFYVSLISDYKSDLELLEQLDEDSIPTTSDEIARRKSLVEEGEKRLKTKGRARDNIEEWLVQLDLYENKLAYERGAKTTVEPEPSKLEKKDEWDAFVKKVTPDLKKSKFIKVSELLKLTAFKNDAANKKKGSMIYLCEKAHGYLETLSKTLGKGIVYAPITLKDGSSFSSFKEASVRGVMIEDSNGSREVLWGMLNTESVINLVKISLRDDVSQFEKNLRVEQAIAYAWLGDERDKAKAAASELSSQSEQFSNRWAMCMELLDK